MNAAERGGSMSNEPRALRRRADARGVGMRSSGIWVVDHE